MLQDILACRPTEIGTLNEGLVAEGREAGVPTPVNEAVVDLIRGLEDSWVRSGRCRRDRLLAGGEVPGKRPKCIDGCDERLHVLGVQMPKTRAEQLAPRSFALPADLLRLRGWGQPGDAAVA